MNIESFLKVQDVYKDKEEVGEFHLPIYYLENKEEIPESTRVDLELNKTELTESLYSYIFDSKNDYDNNIKEEFSKYYTTDTNFLKGYQKFIKKYEPLRVSNNIKDEMNNLLKNIKRETNFNEKYNYIENSYLQVLNTIPNFLQALTIYNLASPLITLVMPILLLLLPFVMLKSFGPNITFSQYFNTLMSILKHNSVFEGLMSFRKVTMDRKVIIIVSTFLYISNIYQNIFKGYTFYKNLTKIQDELNIINNFYKKSSELHSRIKENAPESWKDFIEQGNIVQKQMDLYRNEIDKIGLHSIRIKKLTSMGLMLKCYHELYKNGQHQKCIEYCMHLHSFDDKIKTLKDRIELKQINYCKFSKERGKFKNIYYPALIDNNPIKNSLAFKNNYIITGPNASGKTTMLKAIIFNYILSQQIGVGTYDSASFKPVKYIHSYINIPDTSERDSLFQAEARRCKDIIERIDNSDSNENHLCILDELYSGTNPDEAVASGYAFLNYLSNKENVIFFLTTHYYEICNMSEENKAISNYHMELKENKFTYKFKIGQSKVYGGLKVLKDLEYPKSLIENAKNILNSKNRVLR